MNKKILSFILAVSMLCSMGIIQLNVYAETESGTEFHTDQNGTILTDEPIVTETYYSEVYKQYLKDKENGELEKYGGAVPDSGYKLRREDIKAVKTKSAFSLPPVYDPRITGMTTPVKDQGTRGLCWSFAACANLETAAKYEFNKEFDFSENFYNYLFASDALGPDTVNPYMPTGRKLEDEGVTRYVQTQYSGIIGRGPILENQFPYSITGYLPDLTLLEQEPAYYIYNYDSKKGYDYRLDISEAQGRIAEIKNMVYQDHSATIDIIYNSKYCNHSTGALYYPKQAGETLGDHRVCIVGWDDNYSRENFLESCRPDSNGAFIVKNSWGTKYGDRGYYYLSYQDDRVFQSDIFSVSDISETQRYDNLYYYTEFTPYERIVMNTGDVWCANVYDITSKNQVLNAVGIATLFKNTELEIYVNPNSGMLNPDNLQLVYSGVKQEPGYETIELQDTLALPDKGKFAIAVRIISDDFSLKDRKFIPTGGWHTNAGQSYLSFDAQTWTDTSAQQIGYNFFINAYTNDKGNSLWVRFRTPNNWGSRTNITLQNAGKYSGKTYPMTYVSAGLYEYRNNNLFRADFVIDDGASGHMTSSLCAKGNVTVENNTVTPELHPMLVEFKKPESWGEKIRIYYYSNDSQETEHAPWPGDVMNARADGWYTYEIKDMNNVRIIFTDGQKQFPGLLQPGIPLERGRNLIWQNYSYAYDDGSPFQFHFYPDSASWGQQAVLRIANGPTQTTVTLQKTSDGYFEYISPSINRALVTISNGGSQSTNSLLLGGALTMKGNDFVIRPDKTSTITFKPPAEWQNAQTVYLYYYTDNARALTLYDWPGIPMEPDGSGRFNANISDLGDVRVVFSDGGKHQLPAFNQPGIKVKSGQHLINENKTNFYEDGTPLSVYFVPGDDWGENAVITLRYMLNGKEHSMVTPMSLNQDGIYIKDYSAVKCSTGTVSIRDSAGHSTNEFLITGPVTISYIKSIAVQRPKEPLHVVFEKPEGWGDNVYIYYYANDDSYASTIMWPGKRMQKTTEGKYTYDITDMKFARAIFTDGTNRYPAGSNGIPINDEGSTSIKGR